MRGLRALASAIAFMALSAQSVPDRYAVGQVWQYRTRAGDEGSLLKIQRIEDAPGTGEPAKIFHISVVGFRLRAPHVVPMLAHAPVSRETLDKSVTNLSTDRRTFPPVDAGIDEWRQAKGGFFTISVAEIVTLLDRTTLEQGAKNRTKATTD